MEFISKIKFGFGCVREEKPSMTCLQIRDLWLQVHTTVIVYLILMQNLLIFG